MPHLSTFAAYVEEVAERNALHLVPSVLNQAAHQLRCGHPLVIQASHVVRDISQKRLDQSDMFQALK